MHNIHPGPFDPYVSFPYKRLEHIHYRFGVIQKKMFSWVVVKMPP